MIQGKTKKLFLLIIFLSAFVIIMISTAYNFKFTSLTGKSIIGGISEQEASIRFVIPIVKAEHLDSNRQSISDIYDEVKELDDIWSETIPKNDYIRVTFEESLTNKNDIKIYPRVISGNPRIEVYENNGDKIITTFDSLTSNEYNKVYLTKLQGEQDTFDLRVLNGSVEFDHIIDPFTARTETAASGSTLSSPYNFVVNKPTETVNGDIMFMFLTTRATTSIATVDSVPDGWTLIAYNTVVSGTSYMTWYLYYKIASGEGTSYTWSLSKSTRYYAVNTAYSAGDFDVQSIDDIIVSNTLYGTAGTTVRAASMNVPNANSPLVFFGSVYTTTVRAFTEPSVPDTWVEDYEYGSTTPDISGCIDSMIWTGSGDTDNMDATCAASITGVKHAFAVALKSAAGDTEYPQFSSLTETPGDPATYSYGQNYQFNATITSTNGTAGIEFNGVNHTATNSGDVFSVTISDLTANTGGYNYYWWALGNGTDNNFNSTTTQTYAINKAIPQGSISGTSPLTYGTAGDVEGTESNSGDGGVQYKLYRNGTEVSNPDTSTLAAGFYSYVYNATSGANYTLNASIGTFGLTVNKNPGTCDVLFNETSPLIYPSAFKVYSDCDTSFTLKRNGTTISNNSVQTLSGGTWNFSVQRTDTQNYSNTYDEEIFTINKFTNGAVLTLSPSNSENYGTETTVSCSVDYGTPQLYRGGALISTPDIQTLGVGTYNYVCNVSESRNWTSATDSDTLTISQVSSQTSLTFDKASSQSYGTEITPTCSIIAGQGSTVLTMDGNVITSGNPLTPGAGTYTFNCSLAESQNYTSSENVSDFTIDKAVPAGSLASTEGWTITYPTETTISLSESNSGDGDVTYVIYRDGISIGTGETITFGYGTYDYILNTTGGANYTSNSSMDTQTLTISQNPSNCQVLFNETSPLTHPSAFKVYSDCDSDFTLYRNGTEVSNNSEQVLSAGAWNFSVQRTDTQNYSNTYDEEIFTINQATGQINGYVNNTQANFTAVDGTANKNIYLNATLTSPCTGTGSIVVNGAIYTTGTLPLYNITDLSIGFYNVTFSYDGNTNCSPDTEVWWINITEAPDDPPAISIIYPENTTYTIDITRLDYTAEDDISLSHCWYSLDGGATNSTPDATCSNLSGLESDEGSNIWIVYVNDSKGQESSDSVIFVKDTIYPLFSNYLRNPDSPNEDQDVQVNVTITETNLDTVLLELDGTTNYTVTINNGNEYYITIAKENYTAHDSVTYCWYANDTAGNLNKSSQQSFTVSNQIPSVSAPAINDTTPQTDDLISCDEGSFSDNDAEDSEQERYFRWYDDDAEISGQNSQTLNLSISGLDKTDEIKCSARVYDGYDNSSWVNSSNSATIQNSPPVITNLQITVSWDANGSTFNYDYEATDADTGDSFTWYDNTTLFDINSGTGVISDTPEESEAGTYSVLINVSDGTDQDADEFSYIIIDVTNPDIELVLPTEADNSQLTRDYIQVNVTASDGKAIDTIIIRLYNSTDLVQTNTSSVSPLFVNFTDLPDENYYFNATVNDTSGNENQTETRTVTIDTGAPTMNYVSPTENSGVYKSQNYVEVNVTASDPNLDTITIRLYNSEHMQIDSDTSSSSPNFANFTGLNDGLYYYNATANDTFGNENSLETRNITLDTIKPSIADLAESPTDPATYTQEATYQFNATITDNNLDIVLIEFNNVNYTPIKTGNVYNLTLNDLAAGNYGYYWLANDSAGNVNITAQTLTISQNPSNCQVLFNETSPLTHPSAFKVYSDCDSDFTLYRNGTEVSNNSEQVLSAGAWNFTVQRTDTENYSDVYDEGIFTISQATGDITLLINGTADNQTGIYGVQTNASASTSYGTITLYRDGTDMTSENNDFIILGVGYYNYTAESSGDQNHSSASITRFVNLTQTNSKINLTINGTEANITIIQDSSIWINITTITGDSGATLKLYNNGTLINQGNSPLGNLTTFNVIGLFNITGIYTESQNYTESYETFWVAVTEAPDLTNPSVSGLTETPSDPATYSSGQIYQFNATITDNRQLDAVLIEFDGVNYTATNIAGNIYNFTINNLAAGTYDYRWYANDTSGNMNSTENGTYAINQASPSLILTITPSASETYGTETTATGSNCPNQLICSLYRDGISTDNPETIILGAGTYNYTYNMTGNANYTSASASENLTVNQNPGTCDVLFNETSPLTHPSAFKVYSDCDSDFTLYRNGTEVSNNSEQVLSAGAWNFSVQRTDTQNYSNTYDEEIFTITKSTGIIYTYINNSRANKTIEQYTGIYLSGTLETGSGNIKLYNNGTLINEGNSPLSNLTNFTTIGLYNITAVYDGNENYTPDIETWWVTVLEADVTPPNIEIIYPANTSYNFVQTQLNYTASDNFGLNSCWYSTDNGQTNTTISCNENITGLNSGQGSSAWIVWANDAKGNENSSSIAFFADSINPLIQFVAPAQTNDSSTSENLIEINVSASDANLDSIVVRLYNSTRDLIRTNLSSTSPYYINYAGLPAGTYYYNATANDTLNNQNSTETREISLILPALIITKPKNQTYISGKNLPLYYSAEYEDSVWYNLDHGSNMTITKNTVFDVLSEGSHTLYLYANNSNGETESSVTFAISPDKIKVNYDKYKGDKKGTSTDFNVSSYEELQNLSGIILEDTDYGKIEFNDVINLTDDENPEDNETDLDSYTDISNNKIEINSSALPNFNKSATLYLYNLTFTNPRILKDGVACPPAICTQESYIGGTLKTLKFNVIGFTTYSAQETPAGESVTSSPSGGGGGYECSQNSNCRYGQYCLNYRCYEAKCFQNSDCKKDEFCLNYQCTKLFDIKIIDFESPAKLGEFFDFTYFIKGMADISGDVEINFWIEKAEEKISSGSDVIYLGKFEEKTETTKIFLPKIVESGVYQFFIQVSYGTYDVKAHRTIEIEVKEEIAKIAPIKTDFKIYVILALIILIVLILFFIYYLRKNLRINMVKEGPSIEKEKQEEIPGEKFKEPQVKLTYPLLLSRKNLAYLYDALKASLLNVTRHIRALFEKRKIEENFEKGKSTEQLIKEIREKLVAQQSSEENKPKQNFIKQSEEKTKEELDEILDQMEIQDKSKNTESD